METTLNINLSKMSFTGKTKIFRWLNLCFINRKLKHEFITPLNKGLGEKHLKKEEEIRMSGYSQIFCNHRSANTGDIMSAVKENVRTITLVVAQDEETRQSLWSCIYNRSYICPTGKCNIKQ